MRKTRNYMALPYNPALKQRARELRRAGNLAEVLLWNQIKGKQLRGLDFDRQKIVGNYIVDFYCAERQVVLEVDGSSHDHKVEYDAARDAFLVGLGLTVIHIADADVKNNLAGMVAMLQVHPALREAEEIAGGRSRATTPALRATPPEEGNLALRTTPPEEGNLALRTTPQEEGNR